MINTAFKLILFTFFFFFYDVLISQINDTALYYPNGSISSRGIFLDGKPHGHWINYYIDGKIKSEGDYNYGLLHGTWIFYDTLGNFMAEINYINGKKSGKKKYLKDNLIIEENYRDDVLIDKYTEYYLNGNVRRIIPVRNGKFDGETIIYDSLNNPISVESYKNGILISREDINRYDLNRNPHGKWKFFYRNGHVKKEIDYFHGKKHGYVKQYDSLGNLSKIEKYLNDTLVKGSDETVQFEVLRDYYSNGKIKVEAVYKNGVPNGVRYEYDSVGNITKTYFFSNGELIFEGKIDNFGKRQGPVIEYSNGKIAAKGFYKNDLKHGEWIYYDDNGNVYQRGEYHEDKPIGRWVTFYPSGKIQRIENYEDGLLNGEYVELIEDSSIVVKGFYVDGQKHGRWIYQIGDVYQENNYNHGELQGKQSIYDKSSNFPIVLENYKYGTLDGKQHYFRTDGIRHVEAVYRNGTPHGTWIYYDSDGKRFLRIVYVDGNEVFIENSKLP